MHYLSKKGLLITIIWTIFFGLTSLSAENLYSCTYNGQVATYHQDEAKRMQVLGADCHLMNTYERITCSMNGVKVDYSRSEAEKLLATYPDVTCEINNKLFLSLTIQKIVDSVKPLVHVRSFTTYFSINNSLLTRYEKNKLKELAMLYHNMSYKFTITGYASATGNASHNHILSLKRARNVLDELLRNGVSRDDILSVDALGEESLRYRTPYEEKLNRAVVIKAYRR